MAYLSPLCANIQCQKLIEEYLQNSDEEKCMVQEIYTLYLKVAESFNNTKKSGNIASISPS